MTRSKRLPVVLTDQEIERLLAQANTRTITGLRTRAMIETMLGAGLRVGELVALKPRNVDLQEGMIRVDLGKGGRDRVIPVNNSTHAWMEAWSRARQEHGLNGRTRFFCSVQRGQSGRKLSPRYVQALIKRLAERAEIDRRVTPHTLRHTFATRMLKSGFNIREIQVLLGHSSVATTQIYTHVDPQELKAKVQGKDKKAEPLDGALAAFVRTLSAKQRETLGRALGTAHAS